jgi:hypothetical protein
MNCVVLLENCMGLVEGETGYCSGTWVMGGVGGTAEVSVEFEGSIDRRDEIPEAIRIPPIKNKHEVRLQGVCKVVAACAFRPSIATKIKV